MIIIILSSLFNQQYIIIINMDQHHIKLEMNLFNHIAINSDSPTTT